jgi:hypothetical protein
LRQLLEQLDPQRRFRGGPFEYRVVTLEGERMNLQPVRVALGMPELRRVTVRPGVAGCKAKVPLGSRVLVAFINNDAGRAIVVGFEDAEGAGFTPDRLDLVGADDPWDPVTRRRCLQFCRSPASQYHRRCSQRSLGCAHDDGSCIHVRARRVVARRRRSNARGD